MPEVYTSMNLATRFFSIQVDLIDDATVISDGPSDRIGSIYGYDHKSRSNSKNKQAIDDVMSWVRMLDHKNHLLNESLALSVTSTQVLIVRR